MSKFGGMALDLADRYSEILNPVLGRSCGEHSGAYAANFLWTERHLQCVWFDSRYRPPVFSLANGETVTVLHPAAGGIAFVTPEMPEAELQEKLTAFEDGAIVSVIRIAE